MGNWAKKKKKTTSAFFFGNVSGYNQIKEVAMLHLTLTTKEELICDVEYRRAIEDSDHDLLELFLISFLF